MDSKYTYNLWRPYHAIRLADPAFSPNVVADPAWTPLLGTPRHQEYISNHGVFLLLIELAVLIGVTRVGAELFKRLGLPSVVGELGAGILLGPSVFGRLAPETFSLLFPQQGDQFRLLDVIGTLGMTFLLLARRRAAPAPSSPPPPARGGRGCRRGRRLRSAA